MHSLLASTAYLRHAARRHNTAQHRRVQYTRRARAGHDLQDQDLLLDLHHGACRPPADDNRSEDASSVRDDTGARPVFRRDVDGQRLV